MKQNISFIYLDSVLADWLCSKLMREAPGTVCADELLTGIRDLKEGRIEIVSLAVSGKTDSFVNFADNSICSGELVIYPKSRKVVRGKTEINLTPKEFDILYFLAQNRGTVFTKEQVYRAVWGDGFLFTDSNMMAFIRKLRKKIEINPDKPEYILTVWGIGYKFRDSSDI